MDRAGGPVGCSMARIGGWKLLGVQEVSSQGLLAFIDACNGLRHSKGVGLELGRVYPTGELCVKFDTSE